MPSVAAALTLLLVNLGLIAAVLAYSPTPRGTRTQSPPTDRCFVCASSDPDTTVSEYPLCNGCKAEYFQIG